MSCFECGLWGARLYPFPSLEDADLFEDGREELRGSKTIGTLWCPRCDPVWGEFLLQQMTIWAIRSRETAMPPEPAMPLLGGDPVEGIAFLESELADFLDGPGPMTATAGGPLAPRSDDFLFACADLISWMREVRRCGFLQFRTVAA
jgi:hypothetical protein